MGGTNRFVYVASAIAAINGALFGYDTGIISGDPETKGRSLEDIQDLWRKRAGEAQDR